jgi:hypothetical protein
LGQVDDEFPRTTKQSIVLVNKHFYATVQLVAHRRKSVDYKEINDPAIHKQIQTWLGNPLILRSIRQININGVAHLSHRARAAVSAETVAAMWAPLVELVTEAARLTKVNFDFGAVVFPLELLEALQTYHPRAKLCIWRSHRDEELDHTDAAEQALAVSPLLRKIKTYIWERDSSADIDLRLAAFQRIVASAPNLEFASVSRGSSGCVIPYQSTEDHAREVEAAAKFFLQSPGPNTSIRSLTLDGFRLHKETLDEWGKYVSLPHLERLKCSRGLPESSYFEAAPALLTNLKHVSLNLLDASHRPGLASLVDHYLASCAPLETLSLWCWMGVVSLDTILKHGPTLTTLQLHEREASDLGTRRGLLSTNDLCRIRDECPQLQDLTLDMDREDADWKKDLDIHKAVLEEVARFGRRLRKAQIYLDLGVANHVTGLGSQGGHRNTEDEASSADDDAEGNSDTPTEYIYRGPFPPCSRADMKQHAVEVWKIIFGDPSNKGPRELDIKWGEWERKMGGGYPDSRVMWEQQNVSHVRVRPAERDDKLGEAVAQVLGRFGLEF